MTAWSFAPKNGANFSMFCAVEGELVRLDYTYDSEEMKMSYTVARQNVTALNSTLVEMVVTS